ncbi:MAG: flagellar hook-associated protein FlgL [Proteobacteria bacterium]|nr:flagellar hook-associated protein FlgL [Pseudomonadota bacterium]
MKFKSSLYNLNSLQSGSKTIMDQMSSQKKVNRPSDDPIGIGKILDIRHVQQMNDQYQKNIESADSWLKMTEAKLSDLSGLLVSAREIAVAQATATATSETRRIAAASVEQLTEQMFGIANSQYMDRYIFAGSRSDQPPFSKDGVQGGTVDLAMAMTSGANNGYGGTASTVVRSIRLADVAVGDTITLEGSVYTAVASGANPAAGQFNVGADDAQTADSLRTTIETLNPGVYTLGGVGTDIIAITKKHQVSTQGWPDTALTPVGDAGGDFEIQVGNQGTITIPDADITATTTLEELRDLINSNPGNVGPTAVTAAIADDGSGVNPYHLVITADNGGPDYRVSILSNPTDLTFSSQNTAELNSVATNNQAHFSSYIGDANNTYALKIITGGTLADATYAVSRDGGRTWGVELTNLDSGSVVIGDGVAMSFAPGVFAANDIFTVRASTPGYFSGDGEEAAIDIGEGSPFAYGISGEAVFTDRGAVGVDVFAVMQDLKKALDANDPSGIQAQIDKLKDANDQVQLGTTKSGARMNRMEVARSYQEDYELRAADMLSKIEDADITKLVTDMATIQLALQASYKVTTIITQESTILDFLK